MISLKFTKIHNFLLMERGMRLSARPLLSTEQVSLEQHYTEKAYSMPDLTSFLCALVPEHVGPKLGYVEVEEQEGGTLLFQKSDQGILMFELDGVREFKAKNIDEIFESLSQGKAVL